MADQTKLMLSELELRFAQDTNWVLTKQHIIQTVYHLFNEQVGVIKKEIQVVVTNELEKLSGTVPKISKGENYKTLPYVILDYPSIFQKEDVFALRTMFWWGRFVSITLHLSGSYAAQFRERIATNIEADPGGLYICISQTQWEHHFESTNYRQASGIPKVELADILENTGFIKLAIKFPLDEWNQMPELLQEGYKKIAYLLAA